MARTVIFLCLIVALPACSKKKTFDFPINEIKTIKTLSYDNKPIYKPLILTPESYSSTAFNRKQEVVASFIYRDQKASVKMVIDYPNNSINFIRLGKKSDFFVFAISELFEEELEKPVMKDTIECSFYDGEPKDFGLLGKEQRYKLGYELNKNDTKGSVQMILKINLQRGYIELMEKNAGLAKMNFVKAFEE